MKLFSYRVAPFLLALALWLGGNLLLGIGQVRGDELMTVPSQCEPAETATFSVDCTTASGCISADTASAKCVPVLGCSIFCSTVFDAARPVVLYTAVCPCPPFNTSMGNHPGYIYSGKTTGPGQICPP